MRDAEEAFSKFTAARIRLAGDSSEAPSLGGAVTAQWVNVRELSAGEVAEVIRGVRFRPEDCLADGVRVLRTRDIRDTITDDEPCFAIPDEMKPRPHLTQPGDVILSPASGRLRAVVDETGGHILASPCRHSASGPAGSTRMSPRRFSRARGIGDSQRARAQASPALTFAILSFPCSRSTRREGSERRSTCSLAPSGRKRELAERAHDVRESILTGWGYRWSGMRVMERAELWRAAR